ncbi:MAG TPA: hypothetical protein PKZ32_11390 [Candidatus Melainabacteria bacterium]|nr:hypothetical protein [Candidatus Melainabacteria bacterium]
MSSTGDYDSRPVDVYQFAGDNQNNQGDRTDLYQFNGGDALSQIRQDAWPVQRGDTQSLGFPRDSQGFQIVNYGTVNIFTSGGNGYDDAACRAMQAAKLNDMMSGRWDNYSDSFRDQWAPENNRLSDFRRQALIRDGQMMDQQFRDMYARSYYNPDAYYDRNFNDLAYRRPGGPNINYTHGGRDGISFYRSEPSYSSLPPWVNDDCFGTGRDRNGYRLFQDLLQTSLSYDIARRHARNNDGSGRWDYRHDSNRMNPIEMMLMANAIGGSRYDRFSNRFFDDRNINYTHGGRDGLSFYNQSPSWDRAGGNVGLGLLEDGLKTYLAYDIARRSVPRYESHRNVDSYYGNNYRMANHDFDDRGSQQAFAMARREMMRQRNAELSAYNRQRALERRGYA